VSVVTGCRLTDNLPCSTKFVLKNNEEQHEHGYRLGAVINDKVPAHFADHLLFIIMVALCNGADHYIFILFLLSFFFLLLSFFSSPNLSSRRLDVYHTLAHGVALVRI